MSHPNPNFDHENVYPEDGVIFEKMNKVHSKQLGIMEQLSQKRNEEMTPLQEGWIKGEPVTNFPK